MKAKERQILSCSPSLGPRSLQTVPYSKNRQHMGSRTQWLQPNTRLSFLEFGCDLPWHSSEKLVFWKGLPLPLCFVAVSTFHLPKDEALPNRQTGLPKPLVLQEGAEAGGVDGLRAAGSRNGGQGMGWKKPILGLWWSSSHTWETMKRSF